MARIGTLTTARQLTAHFGAEAFTLDDARAAGVSPRRLEGAVRAHTVRRLRRGVYAVMAPTADSRHLMLIEAIAALDRRGIPAVVGGRYASSRWGIPEFAEVRLPSPSPYGLRTQWRRLPPAVPTLLVPPGSGLRPGLRHGVLIREAPLTADEVTVLDGLPITTPIRTAVDVARETAISRIGALVPLNAGVRIHALWQRGMPFDVEAGTATELVRSGAVREQAVGALARCLERSPRRGSSWLHDALPLVEPLLETALESVSWGRIDEAGMDLPRPQEWVQGASGRDYRVDFDQDGVIGEADGAVKYAGEDSLWKEKRRQADLEATGRPFVRWIWQEAVFRPTAFLSRIDQAKRRAA